MYLFVADKFTIKVKPPLCGGVQGCMGGKGNHSFECIASKQQYTKFVVN